MNMLDNSTQELMLYQKCLLYRTCVLFIALYRFPLCFYNKAPLSYLLKNFNKMQQKAEIWILGAFCILPSIEIKAIAMLIPIIHHF